MDIWENISQLVLISELVLYTHAANEARKGSAFWQGFLNPFNL